MIHSSKFICVLDTNVIYPITIRDILFWFAYDELYTPKWSKHIFDEWKNVMARKGVDNAEIEKRVIHAFKIFPDAMVEKYEALIDNLELPDEKDRHVLAAAVKVNANLIVTNNLKDFPKDYLNQYGLAAKSPDDFLCDIIDLNHDKCLESFYRLVANKKKPPLDEYQVLDQLRIVGLKNTADYLHTLL